MSKLDDIEKGTLCEAPDSVGGQRSPQINACVRRIEERDRADEMQEYLNSDEFKRFQSRGAHDQRLPENVRDMLSLMAVRLTDISRELEAVDFLDPNRAATTISRCAERIADEKARLYKCVADSSGVEGKREPLERARAHLHTAVQDIESALFAVNGGVR